MLYTMTVCGVAYLIRLDNIKNYESYSVFPPNEVAELNTQSYGVHVAITAIAAAAGFLATGHLDGSFACYRFGFLDSKSPGLVTNFYILCARVGDIFLTITDHLSHRLPTFKVCFISWMKWICQWNMHGKWTITIHYNFTWPAGMK